MQAGELEPSASAWSGFFQVGNKARVMGINELDACATSLFSFHCHRMIKKPLALKNAPQEASLGWRVVIFVIAACGLVIGIIGVLTYSAILIVASWRKVSDEERAIIRERNETVAFLKNLESSCTISRHWKLQIELAWSRQIHDSSKGLYDLKFYGPPPDLAAAHLERLPGLESVSFLGVERFDSKLDPLHELTRPTQLSFGQTKLGNDALTHLSGLTQLKTLWLAETQISDEVLIHLRGLVRLRELGLNRNRISGPGLAHLTALPQLADLRLEHTDVGDAGLEHIAALPSLTSLYLANTPITNEGMNHLSALRNLKSLDLRYTQVGDDGLRGLAALSKLKTLNLDGTHVSDAGLPYLAAFHDMQLVELRFTSVTSGGVQQLQRSLPNARIEY